MKKLLYSECIFLMHRAGQQDLRGVPQLICSLQHYVRQAQGSSDGGCLFVQCAGIQGHVVWSYEAFWDPWPHRYDHRLASLHPSPSGAVAWRQENRFCHRYVCQGRPAMGAWGLDTTGHREHQHDSGGGLVFEHPCARRGASWRRWRRAWSYVRSARRPYPVLWLSGDGARHLQLPLLGSGCVRLE